HAVGLILRDIPSTLRAIAPALGLIVVAALTLAVFAPEAARVFIQNPQDMTAPGPIVSLAPALLGVLIFGVGFSVMAVLWHRHVLLDDRTVASRPQAYVITGYIGRLILLSLMSILLFVPVLLVNQGAAMLHLWVLPLVAQVGVIAVRVIMLRFSLILPAISIGTRLSMAQSWQATAPMTVPILWVTVILSLANSILGWLIAFALNAAPLFLMGGVNLGLALVSTLVGVSVMTTLYGVLIEERGLNT
ncbi:MAG: hypothetical protein AB8B71_13605, partial [Paracoccaceae bacterium]